MLGRLLLLKLFPLLHPQPFDSFIQPALIKPIYWFIKGAGHSERELNETMFIGNLGCYIPKRRDFANILSSDLERQMQVKLFVQ